MSEPVKPESLHPAYIDGPSVSHIAAQVYDGLFRYQAENLELAFNLIDDADMDDTKTIYTFEIKKGVYFHADMCFEEEREVTAEDIKYSLELLCQPNENSTSFERTFKGKIKGADEYHAGKTAEVSGIRVKGKYEVEIELTKPNKSFPYLLASPISPIVPREAIEKYGKDAHIGSGPFIYFEEDGKVVLRRNKKYHLQDEFGNQLPYLDQVNTYFIPEKEQELEAFFNRKIDIVTGLYLEPVKELMEKHVADFEGENAKYVMQSTSDIAKEEVYYLHRKNVFGFKENFMNHRDYTAVYMKPDYSEFVE